MLIRFERHISERKGQFTGSATVYRLVEMECPPQLGMWVMDGDFEFLVANLHYDTSKTPPLTVWDECFSISEEPPATVGSLAKRYVEEWGWHRD